MNLREISLPKSYNYIACFLTLDCNLKCNFCINRYSGENLFKRSIMPGKNWIESLNRLVCPEDLPLTLQGGEPSLHPDFISIIKNIKKDLNIDILTNLCFDIDKFIQQIQPSRLSRKALYPSIRVSYHPHYMDLNETINKVLKMQQAGFSIGISSILHPKFKEEVLAAQKRCHNLGVDFRTKEFLGFFNGQLYGSYAYNEAIGNNKRKRCLCQTSELIIGSDGSVFKCHHDLYKNFIPIGNLLDSDFQIEDIYRECNEYGDCNPCDIKIKTNRFQVYGHTSVEIKEIKDEILVQ